MISGILDRSTLDGVPTNDFTSFAIRYWPGALAGALLVRADQFLMVPLSTSAQLGLYVTAVTLFEACSFASNAVRDVIFSVESQAREHAARDGRGSSGEPGHAAYGRNCGDGVGAVGSPCLRTGLLWRHACPASTPPGRSARGEFVGRSSRPRPLRQGRMAQRRLGAVTGREGDRAGCSGPCWGALGAAWATLLGTAVVWSVIAAGMWRGESVTPRLSLFPDLTWRLAGLGTTVSLLKGEPLAARSLRIWSTVAVDECPERTAQSRLDLGPALRVQSRQDGQDSVQWHPTNRAENAFSSFYR